MTAGTAAAVEREDGADIRRLVKPNSHEFTANLNFNEYGLQPWFACDAIVKQNNGAVETEIEAFGDLWTVKLYNTDSSNLIPPEDGVTPAGTEIEHGNIREFRIRCEAHDEVGERAANFHIRPRWQYLHGETEYGDITDINVPASLANQDTDAVNVRVAGSNIEFENYITLLKLAAGAVGVNNYYFSERHLHDTSNVQDMARHVRVHRDVSGPLHSRTGPLVQLAHVLENDRSGYRKIVQNDNDENGHNVPGYYHSTTLGPKRIREVLPNHQLPKEIKHYYIRDVQDRSPNDPLAHPKLEVSYQQSRWDKSPDVDADTLADMQQELDEILYDVLHTAGLDLRAGDTYVEDAYFENENGTTAANVVDLDLTQIRHEQESIVFQHFGDGLAPTDKETLQLLVADGGDVSPQDIAEATGRHQDTVYNALARMNHVVDHVYGSVSLKSTYTSELVADALQQAENAVEKATKTAATAVNAANRGLDNATSAFLAWCEKYGVSYDELDGDDLSIDVGEVDSIEDVRRIIRTGFDRWCNMGREAITFKSALVEWVRVDEQDNLNYITRAPQEHYGRQRAHTLLE